MTNKTTMPEPVAWMWDTGTNRGLTWTKCFPPDEERVTSSSLITTDQAEAYANAKVREAKVATSEHCTKLANDLERYNKWRRGAEDIEQPNPTELGVLIDEVVKELRK